MARPLNHFGNLCHGDAPDMFEPGHPLSFDLLYQVYGEDGDGTDLGFYNHSDFVPVDEIPGFQTEEDFWSALGMSVVDVNESPVYQSQSGIDEWEDWMSTILTEEDEGEDYYSPSLQYGHNHRRRGHERTHYEHARHGHGDYRRLARQHRQTIRHLAQG